MKQRLLQNSNFAPDQLSCEMQRSLVMNATFVTTEFDSFHEGALQLESIP